MVIYMVNIYGDIYGDIYGENIHIIYHNEANFYTVI